MRSNRLLPILFVVPLHLACIVDQRLGERDGAAGDTASAADAPPASDAAPPEDVAASVDVASSPDVVDDRSAPVDASPDARADVVIAPDGPAPTVRRIELGVALGRGNPALGPGPGVAVSVLFLSDEPAPRPMGNVIGREGDCLVEVAPSTSAVAARSLGPLQITATPEGGAPVPLTPRPMVQGPWVIAEFGASLPDLSPGTRVRVAVPATANSPAFTRELVVSDIRYAAPTPITDNATARYLTWAPGAPMQVAWQRVGPAATNVGLTFTTFTTLGQSYAIRCTPAAGAAGLTVGQTVLMPFYEVARAMGVGGASAILTASTTAQGMEGSVAVATGTGAYTVAGVRW